MALPTHGLLQRGSDRWGGLCPRLMSRHTNSQQSSSSALCPSLGSGVLFCVSGRQSLGLTLIPPSRPHSNSLSLLCLLCGLHSISCGDARRPPSAESDTPQLLLKPLGGGLPCAAFSSDCGGHWGPANTTLAELPTVSPHLLRDPREPQHLPSSQSLPRGL